MKKKRIDLNNRIYNLAAVSSQNQPQSKSKSKLKQIYDVTMRSKQNKSPKSSIKKVILPKQEPSQTQHKDYLNRSTRYKAYLESQVINKIKANRKYSYRYAKQSKDRRQVDDSLNKSGAVTSRHERNDSSMDMFKIRRSKAKSSNKVSVSSYSRLQQSPSDFQTAKGLYKEGKFKQALLIANKCLEKETNNRQYQYYTAIIQLNLHNYKRGLELLQKVIKENPQYKKTSFLFAAISAKHLEDYERAYQISSQGLEKYPNYQQLLLYKANICEFMHNYEEAHQNYEKILKIDSNNVDMMLKNAQCLRKMGAFANSLSNLADAFYADKGEHRQQILTKRIQIYLTPQAYNLKQAKKDLNKLINVTHTSPEICYLKGLILQAEGFRKQSVLSFEQCLKQGSSKQTISKALVQITKNKIDDRDFYSAFYHISRSKYFELTGDEIEIYKLFTQGVVQLMKRKITEGDRNFSTLLQRYPKLAPYLNKIFYLYRAFAKFSLSCYKEAIECYEIAHKQYPLDIFAKFNKQLAQGIEQIRFKKYQKGIQYFNAAEKTISFAQLNKIDSYLYRGAAHIQKAKDLINSASTFEEINSLQEIFTGLKELDKAYDINDSNSNLLYYRSLVYLYLGKYDQALQDIVKAISKSEENVAKYFFFRGITYASLGNLKQALNDFNICGNLDDKFELMYLERAKIHFSNQNVTKGLQDLMKLKNINPNEDIKYHQACLNFFYGHYVMANACSEEIQDVQKARKIKILVKTKMGRVKQAKKLARCRVDHMIYDILQGKTQVEQVPSNHLQFFDIYHYHHYLGVRYFRSRQFHRALDTFIMAGKQRNLYDLEKGITSNNLNQGGQNQQQQDDNTEENDKDAINRINYNIFLCYLELKDWKKAYQIFIRDVVGVKEAFLKNQFIASFSHLMFQSMKESSLKYEEKEMYELNLYDSKLERVLPEVIVQLPNFILKTRLCLIGLTDPKLQNIYKTKANPDFILQYMKMSQIENRPEPPWVKREETGLIFTDEVQNINIEFQTTQNDEQNEEQSEDDEQNEGEQQDGDAENGQQNQQQQQQQIKVNQKISMRKFKQKMKLNDSIERKLQKIMEMKKNNTKNSES